MQVGARAGGGDVTRATNIVGSAAHLVGSAADLLEAAWESSGIARLMDDAEDLRVFARHLQERRGRVSL